MQAQAQANATNASDAKIKAEIKDLVFALGYKFGPQWLLISTKIRYQIDSGIPTMGATSDGWVIVNPAFWAGMTNPQRVAVLAHEFLHPVMRHFDRAKALGLIDAKGEVFPGREQDCRTFNVACDMAINPLIRAAGMQLPQNACFPPAEYTGPQDAESIYHWLRSQASQAPSSGRGNQSSGNQSGKGRRSPGQQPPSRGDTDPGAGCGTLPPKDQPGDKGRDQQGGGDQNGNGQGQGQAPTDWDRVAQEARALALQGGSRAGRGSHEFAQAMQPVPPRVPWKNVLGNGFSIANAQRGKERPTYSKISRRGSHDGICRAGWIQTSPRMAVILDVSGSMDREWVSQIISEIQRLIQLYPGAECYVISHTDRIVWEGWIKAGGEHKLNDATRWSGGTDPDPAYARAHELGKLDCVVHFTDCEFVRGWPTPPARLIVGAFGTGASMPYCKPPEGSRLIPCTDGRASD